MSTALYERTASRGRCTPDFVWTDEAVETLGKMLMADSPFRDIAERIGTSRSSVISKAHRLGWCRGMKSMAVNVVSVRPHRPAPPPPPAPLIEPLTRAKSRRAPLCDTEGCRHTAQPGRAHCASCITRHQQKKTARVSGWAPRAAESGLTGKMVCECQNTRFRPDVQPTVHRLPGVQKPEMSTGGQPAPRKGSMTPMRIYADPNPNKQAR